MQIWDAAGVASALHDLVTHNRLAGQLAEAWDKQYPDEMPIVKACEKLRDDWGKMVRFSRTISVLNFAIPVFVMLGVCGILCEMSRGVDMIDPVLTLIVGLTVLISFLLLLTKWKKSIWHEVIAYCQIGDRLWLANRRIRTAYDHYKYIGDASDLVKRLDDMSFEIVRIEMLGQKGLKFPNPFPLTCNHEDTEISFDVLQNNFRQQVKELSSLGLVTSDLSVHFAAAKAKWSKQAADGHLMTDFQI